ncbi:MAG: GntR family transcriptional regulator [Sulfobacillus thermosulfidooxidans]|nr:MAG: GntR family transcriptional regulator [Sulfobacillus thermosulfidooxidans]
MQSKHEEAYHILRQRILSGALTSGYRLVTDNLARELDMSASPIREAIRRLEAEGLVTHIRNVGALVTTMDSTRYVSALETLAVLEGYATATAAAAMTPRDFEKLETLTDHMHDAINQADPLKYHQLNRAFHEGIYAVCPNSVLTEQIHRLWDSLDAIRHNIFILLPERTQASLTEHYRLINAMRSGKDPAFIEQLARAHKQATIKAFLASQHVDNTGSRSAP